jgi:DNA-binding transcriptional LysR family regulator
MDRFKTMESFIRVARAGSFTTAAGQMGMSRAMISRHIQELETRLGARLLNRTTRFVKLTDIGTAYFEFCRELLGEIDARERSIVKSQSQIQGSLKVSASKGFGSLCIADAVAQFSLEHEQIVVTLLIADFSPRAYAFVEQGLHVAIRLSPHRDSAIAARKIGTFNYVVCASPSYLSRHGEPKVPADLSAHKCLMHSSLRGGVWPLKGPSGLESIQIDGYFSSNLSVVLRKAALRGLGIAMLPLYCAANDLKAGTLVHILEKYKVPERPVYALFPHAKLMPAATRAFIEFLVSWFKGGSSPLKVTGDEVLGARSLGEDEGVPGNGSRESSSTRSHSRSH